MWEVTTIKIKLKKNNKSTNNRIKFDLEKLKDPSIVETFKAQLGGKFAALSLIDIDINELTSGFNEAIKSTATEALGKQRKKKKTALDN